MKQLYDSALRLEKPKPSPIVICSRVIRFQCHNINAVPYSLKQVAQNTQLENEYALALAINTKPKSSGFVHYKHTCST